MDKKQTKRALLIEHLAAANLEHIGAAEAARIAEVLAPVSPRYLRSLLRDCGVGLTPIVEGVRQSSFEELERTLLALRHEYLAGGPAVRHAARRLVIEAKDHAKLALARRGDQAASRVEMVQWMLVWLENPDAFDVWLRLRQRALTATRSTAPE